MGKGKDAKVPDEPKVPEEPIESVIIPDYAEAINTFVDQETEATHEDMEEVLEDPGITKADVLEVLAGKDTVKIYNVSRDLFFMRRGNGRVEGEGDPAAEKLVAEEILTDSEVAAAYRTLIVEKIDERDLKSISTLLVYPPDDIDLSDQNDVIQALLIDELREGNSDWRRLTTLLSRMTKAHNVEIDRDDTHLQEALKKIFYRLQDEIIENPAAYEFRNFLNFVCDSSLRFNFDMPRR